ncbi:hypothetical protein AMS68_007149 [Peltaster fructicola]|uniref:Uncharacterized protein n=1 Tax=Peltaster fructicola TaxID=286661 RepID=A0A6H0Y3N6_9PEZI|nr:hypothetical protein AMS68_007149 [Peltaster fructicola]
MAQLTALSFLFRVDEVRENTHRLRGDGLNEWLPPRALGRHFTDGTAYPSPSTVFRFTASNTLPGQPLRPHVELYNLSEHNREYQCYTMYVGTQDEIFVVDYDATEHEVFDGDDTGGIPDQHAGSPTRADWAELCFQHTPNLDAAYVTYADLDRTLNLHISQRSASALVPPRYQEMSNTNRVRLNGDTALMIGLLALSIPPTEVTNELPRVIREQWHQHQVEGARPAGARQARRGIRVTIWLDGATNENDMTSYQHGTLMGPFYS